MDVTVLIPTQFNGVLTIDTSTGSISVSDIVANSFALQASTGSIDMVNITTNGVLTANTTTGTAKFTKLETQNITIEARTGGIRGSIVGNKDDFTGKSSSTTGKNNLPSVWGSGSKTLNISTTTGTIDVNFIE